jgi:hypothetical protein
MNFASDTIGGTKAISNSRLSWRGLRGGCLNRFVDEPREFLARQSAHFLLNVGLFWFQFLIRSMHDRSVARIRTIVIPLPQGKKLMLKTKHNATILVIYLTLLFAVEAKATTVVLLISPEGIVLASDGKTANMTTRQGDLPPMTTQKIAIIKNRIAVADIGLAGAQGGAANFTFTAWMENLNNRLPSDVSVDAVVDALKTEGAQKLATFEPSLSVLQTKRNSPTDSCDSLMQLVVAGYEASLPRVVVIQFNVDWDALKILVPKVEVREPPSQVGSNFRAYAFGKQEAITNVLNRDSYAYKVASTSCPKTVTKLLNHQVLTLDESSRLATVLVEIEEDVDPNEVGSGAQIVRILPSGKADSSLKDESLPKYSCGDEEQKQEKQKPQELHRAHP